MSATVDNAEAGPSYSAPAYAWTAARRTHHVPSAQLGAGGFFRWARWSPDASAILTTAEDRSFRLYPTPDADAADADSSRPDASPAPLGSPAPFRQPDAIHSAAWYPSASAAVPESFCFAAGVVDHPVRLIDGGSGLVRASYPIVDHRERFVAPHSLAFDPTGTKLYCGFENAIEVFDVQRPGYDQAERIKTTYTRRERGGQKGIISALAFCTDYSGAFAAGSYAGSVALYDADGGAVQHLEGVAGGGVTQLAYHPLAPHTLYVASRRSTCVQAYDTRNPSCAIDAYARAGETNQRLAFDVDPWGRYLAAGGTDGVVRVWDTSRPAEDGLLAELDVADDAVGSVQLHPLRPLVLVAAGSRAHLFAPDGADAPSDTSDASSSESGSDSGSDDGGEDEADGGRVVGVPFAGAPSPARQRRPAAGGLALWSFAGAAASSALAADAGAGSATASGLQGA